MKPINLTFSIAEQSFELSRSLGLLNLSVKMVEMLSRRPEIGRFSLLGNHPVARRLDLPKKVEVSFHDEAMGRGLRRILWDQSGVYSAAKKTCNDWLFMPKGFVSFLRPCPAKLLAYVPDVMFDYYERNYPDETREFANRLENIYLKRCFLATLKQAKIIFTCSEFSNLELRHLARRWGIKPPLLVALGTGFSHIKPVRTEKKNRIVVIATTAPHKRTDLAIDYLKRWQIETSFSGQMDWVGSATAGISLPPFANWKLHERVPESEYRHLIAQAAALVHFTEYEGFGMTPVEAVIQGTCPVYSDIPVSREVLDGMGSPFLNQSYESFARAMETAFKASENEIADWAKKLLSRHNWEIGTDKIIRAIHLVEEGQGSA